MATFGDSFDRPDGSPLGTTDTGQTWQFEPGASYDIQGHKARCLAPGKLAWFDAGVRAESAQAEITYQSGSPTEAVSIRVVDANNHLDVIIAGGSLYLFKCQGGTYTQLAVATQTTTNGVTYLVKAVMNGTTLEAWVDGVLKASYALDAGEQAVFDAAGATGVGIRGYADPVRYDNFLATSATFATLSGTSSLTADGQVAISGAANLSASGSLAADATLTLPGSADLSATASLVVYEASTVTGAAALVASGSLGAAGFLVVSGSAVLSARSDLVATPIPELAPNCRRIYAEFADAAGFLADAVDPLVTIVDPAGDEVVVDAVPQHYGPGLYFHDFDYTEELRGLYAAHWSGTVDGAELATTEYFLVSMASARVKVWDGSTWRTAEPV